MKEKKKALGPKTQSSEPSSSSSVFSRPIAGLPGFTIRVLILSFGVLIFSTFVSTLGLSIIATGFGIPFIVLLFLEFVLSKVNKRFQLSVQEWTIYATVGTGLGWLAAIAIAAYLMPSLNARITPEHTGFIPNLWAIPETKLSKEFWTGKTGTWMDIIRAVPWGDWMWPLIYWYVFIATLYLATFFLHTVIRKQWVEVERLAFPGTVATYELIKRAKEHERPSLWKAATENLWFLVGFFIGFGVYIPDILNYWGLLTLPTAGAFFGWWVFNLTPYTSTILPGAKFQFIFIDFLLPVAVFAPMDVLMSAVLCDLIFRVVLPVILVKAAVLTPDVVGIPEPEWTIGIGQGPRWGLIDLLGLSGFTYGIGFFLLAFQWRRIKDTLVAALRGTKRDDGEAFSWRLTWIGFFVCSAIWIYLVTIANVPIVMAVLIWGIIMCWFVFGSRVYAEMATWIQESALQTVVISDIGSRLGYWPAPEVTQAGFNTNLTYATVTFMPKDCSLRPADAMNTFKIGDMTETSPRSIGLAWILMTLVMIGVGLFLWMLVLYKFGFYTLLAKGVWVFPYSASYPISRTLTGLQGGISNPWWNVNVYPYIIGGFALSGVVLYLRTIFPWFFLNPIGVWAGINPLSGQWRLMFIIGFVLKYLTLKIGGAKAYEKFLVPIIVGYAIGLGFAGFIMMPPRLWGALRTL